MPTYHRAVLVTAAVLFTVAVMQAGCEKATGDAGPPQAGPPEVAVVELQPESVPVTTELPGRTVAYLIAEVRPQVGGIIQKRLFEEGSDVKEGDVLYQIDPAPYQATYDTANASLARAEANLPPIQARVNRYETAVAANAVSRQEYDDAIGALEQANAEIAYAKAAVESARINLEYTRIIAPITGRIGRSTVTVGALVSAHQALPLATIQQLDPIYVDAPQSTANMLKFQRYAATGRMKGNPEHARVTLHLADGTPYPLEGTLQFSDATVDPTTGSVILRMVFPNPDHLLLPGMYVRATVQEGVAENAILAPQQGVTRDHRGNPVALIVDAEGKVQQRGLTTERAIGNKWLVTAGLEPGDRIIVEGIQKVRPGVVVHAVPFGSESPAPQSADPTVQQTAQAN